jgi:hypothetical protein
MDYNDLVKYFELYVENYKPYKDNKVYKSMIKFLYNYYLDHSYEEIPSSFKTAFEEQKIPTEFIDVLLLSNGFPKLLLDNLNAADKNILVNSLMDYNQYKGSILSVEKVLSAYDDNFSVYELFLDYKTIINKDDEEVEDWFFVPYAIYKDPDTKEEDIPEYFTFDEIYDDAKHFFINKIELNELRNNKEIVLPIKTNLLILNQNKIEKASILLNFFFIIILNEIKDDRISSGNNKIEDILLDGYDTPINNFTISDIFSLWFYIIYKLYGRDIVFNSPAFSIFFTFDKIENMNSPYTILQIKDLEEEYANLTKPIISEFGQIKNIQDTNYRTRLDKFYKERIYNIFNQFQLTNFNKTQQEWTSIFKEKYGYKLINYIDNKLDNPIIGSTSKTEANKIFNVLYSALVTYTSSKSELEKELIEKYFLDVFPFIIIEPKSTPSFKVLDFIKPFHVELLAGAKQILKVNDSFNSVLIDENFSFFNNLIRASLNEASHNLMFDLRFKSVDNCHILDNCKYIVNRIVNDELAILEHYNIKIISRENSLLNFSHIFNNELIFPISPVSMNIISAVKYIIDSNFKHINNIDNNKNLLITLPIKDLHNYINDNFNFEVKYISNEFLNNLAELIKYIIKISEVIGIDYKYEFESKFLFDSLFDNSDQYSYISELDNFDNNHILISYRLEVL